MRVLRNYRSPGYRGPGFQQVQGELVAQRDYQEAGLCSQKQVVTAKLSIWVPEALVPVRELSQTAEGSPPCAEPRGRK